MSVISRKLYVSIEHSDFSMDNFKLHGIIFLKKSAFIQFKNFQLCKMINETFLW